MLGQVMLDMSIIDHNHFFCIFQCSISNFVECITKRYVLGRSKGRGLSSISLFFNCSFTMPITPLSQSVIHLLGSTQTLTNAHSLVKELIDNALDAKATSIDVMISKDTLEKIEVRDNGHGISKDDFDALGRRGHTSKLKSFEELRSVGGVSLGFRGEALASAVQLGDVTITTKTDGEVVASCLAIRYPGGVSSQTKISHPVGTTISVKKFLHKIPVRQKTAEKAASKTLVQIKELLKAYAFARPHVKFALRIIKESKGSWSYVPKKSQSIKEVATQIVGREVVVECVEQLFSFANTSARSRLMSKGIGPEDTEDGEICSDEDQFLIEMLLPKPGADPGKISCGQFLSVDGRPVANEKGTLKKIVSSFRGCLKSSYDEPFEGVKNPFLRINIKCPIGSYDPNIEPAKDDIIFANESIILEAFENHFRAIYDDRSTASKINQTTKPAEVVDNFDLLLATRPPHFLKKARLLSHGKVKGDQDFHRSEDDLPLVSGETMEDEQAAQDTGRQHHNKWGVDISEDLSEHTETVQLSQKPAGSWQAEFQDGNDSNGIPSRSDGLNPWVIAKLTAPPRLTPSSPPDLPLLAGEEGDSGNFLPTPIQSSGSVALPRDTRSFKLTRSQDGHQTSGEDLAAGADQHNNHLVNASSVYNITPESHFTMQYIGHSDHQNGINPDDDLFIPQPRNGFRSARVVTEVDVSEPTIPESVKLPRRSRALANRPFVSPLLSLNAPLARDNLRQSTLGIAKQSRLSGSEAVLTDQEQHEADLAWAMDFEHRKEALERHQRSERRASRRRLPVDDEAVDEGQSSKRPSPHKNRYLAAAAALNADVDVTLNGMSPTKYPKSMIPDGDPRSYYIKRQKIMAAQPNKTTRMKSYRLPLERIPEGSQLNSVALKLKASTALINGLGDRLGRHDRYNGQGELVGGLPLVIDEEDLILRKVGELAMAWKEKMTEGDLEFDFAIVELSAL